MVLTVLVNKRFVFIRVIRGQKINAVVLTFLRRCRAVCTPLFLLSNLPYCCENVFQPLSSSQAASTLLLLCSYPAPWHTPAIPLAYPNRLPGYAKGMPTLCEGYAKGMPVYTSKLFLFTKKSISPIIRMPFSLRQGLMLSFTITIFLKESSILTNDWVS